MPLQGLDILQQARHVPGPTRNSCSETACYRLSGVDSDCEPPLKCLSDSAMNLPHDSNAVVFFSVAQESAVLGS